MSRALIREMASFLVTWVQTQARWLALNSARCRLHTSSPVGADDKAHIELQDMDWEGGGVFPELCSTSRGNPGKAFLISNRLLLHFTKDTPFTLLGVAVLLKLNRHVWMW